MADLYKIIKKPEFIKRNDRKEEHLMKLLFQSGSASLLFNKISYAFVFHCTWSVHGFCGRDAA